MDIEQLDNITCYLIWYVFRNENIVFHGDETTDFLLDIIATLHNYLYKEVAGEPYDYMWHWYNKITGTVDLEDDLFSLLKEKEEKDAYKIVENYLKEVENNE